jgi:hypothetical protein
LAAAGLAPFHRRERSPHGHVEALTRVSGFGRVLTLF